MTMSNSIYGNNNTNNSSDISESSHTAATSSKNNIVSGNSNNNNNANIETNDDSDDERDLTNLTWLTELRNQNLTWPSAIQPPPLEDEDIKNNSINNNVGSGRIQHNSNNKNAISRGSDIDVMHCSIVLNDADVDVDMDDSEEGIETAGGQYVHDCNNIVDTLIGGVCRCVGLPNNVGRNETNDRSSKKLLKLSQQQQQQSQPQAKRPTPVERYEIFVNKVKRDWEDYKQSAINYQTDTSGKPPFNYSHIIGMAMLENGRVTLQQICTWIETKFAFFRVRKKWNNSIRHNLSLHHCFRKIDRKKYEKGKGGYWELGVDPKKCDRKRIRNRKGAPSAIYRVRQQQQQNVPTATEKTISPFSDTLKHNILEQYDNNYEVCLHGDVHTTTSLGTSVVVDCANAEQLMLDELDIQHNIDVVSCCQHHNTERQQRHIHISEVLRCDNNVNEAILITNTAANTNDTNISSSSNNAMVQQQHQYQLGTIIIRTTSPISTPVTATVPCTQSTSTISLSSLISNGYDEQQEQQQQNIVYIDDNAITTITGENIVVPAYLSNGGLDDFSLDTNSTETTIAEANVNLNTNAIVSSAVQSAAVAVIAGAKATTLNNKFISIANNNRNDYSQRPNVIVEHFEQSTSLHYSISSPSTVPHQHRHHQHYPIHYITNHHHQQQNQHQQPSSDNFRPYIDGIEEAFQYLRSIDNNREDILDNFLDISVSDY